MSGRARRAPEAAVVNHALPSSAEPERRAGFVPAPLSNPRQHAQPPHVRPADEAQARAAARSTNGGREDPGARAREPGGSAATGQPRGRLVRLRVRRVRRAADAEPARRAHGIRRAPAAMCAVPKTSGLWNINVPKTTLLEHLRWRAPGRRDMGAGGEEHGQLWRGCRARAREPGGCAVTAWPRPHVRRVRPRGCERETPAREAARFETPHHGRRCLRWQRSLRAAVVPCQRRFRSRGGARSHGTCDELARRERGRRRRARTAPAEPRFTCTGV